MKYWKKEMIEYKLFEWLDDLNIEKGIEIEEIKEILIKLEKLKNSKNNSQYNHKISYFR